MPINQMRPDGKPRSAVHELVIQKLLDLGDQAVHIGQHHLYSNVDYLKVAVLDALDEVGCKYFVHLSAVDALVDGQRATGDCRNEAGPGHHCCQGSRRLHGGRGRSIFRQRRNDDGNRVAAYAQYAPPGDR